MTPQVLFSFLTSLAITFLSLPSIIYLAKVKELYPVIRDRDAHTVLIPRLGGFAIFAGLLFSMIFWTPVGQLGDLQYIMCSFIIIFLIGGRDDLLPLSAFKKFIGQLLAALILVFKANLTINSFHGIMGVHDLPYEVSIAFSLFVIIALINAINLVDGINGLAGMIGLLSCTSFGFYFAIAGNEVMATISFSMAGALVAFLIYNLQGKIFMGDTGALLIGTISAVSVIKFLETAARPDTPIPVQAIPALAITVLILPIFDTLRVFTLRLLKGKSPFAPDRNHIHHMLLDCGFPHIASTMMLTAGNIALIAVAYILQGLGNTIVILIVFSLALLFTAALFYFSRIKNSPPIENVKDNKSKPQASSSPNVTTHRKSPRTESTVESVSR